MKDKIFDLVKEERLRQEESINLIASENYTSREILELTGSVPTNKYAEGLPGKRYYAGTKIVDKIEQLAIDRVKKLFNAEHANVQPHSGSQANMAAYFALINPGDSVLAMELASAGHLTHGSSVNFSGKLYKFIHYGVNSQTGLIEYETIEKLAKIHKPKLIVAGYSAYTRRLDFPWFSNIAKSVGAKLIVDMAHFSGLVAGGVHPNPVPYADVVTSTTHKTLRGPRGGLILCKAELAKAIDKAVFPGTQGGPLEHVIAAKALCFELASRSSFKSYAMQVVKNAQALADELMRLGLNVLTGGTDNHIVLLDVMTSLAITGKDAEERLEKANITVNRNMIPDDKETPMVTSGLRLGTPALTTRGMKEKEMRTVARAISEILKVEKGSERKEISQEMRKLAKKFPIYK